MNLLEHYNKSKEDYLETAKVGGESHIAYYRDKYPENFKALKEMSETNACFKCKKNYDELYADAFCPHCLTHQ